MKNRYKSYYNSKKSTWYTEGEIMTCIIGNNVFTGIPSEEQLYDWGYREFKEERV